MYRLATSLVVQISLMLFAASAPIPQRPSSTVDPLNQWIGALYNGFNEQRVTTLTSTPLRLRSALNAFAQTHAVSICTANSAALSDTQLVASLAERMGVSTENARMLVVRNVDTVDGALDRWTSAPFLSDIIFPGYVHVGVGVCGNEWVAVLTSEFQ